MDQGQDQKNDRQRRIAEGEKSRSIAQERQAKRTAEIAGKQAQLKLEAQQRAEQRLKKKLSRFNKLRRFNNTRKQVTGRKQATGFLVKTRARTRGEEITGGRGNAWQLCCLGQLCCVNG